MTVTQKPNSATKAFNPQFLILTLLFLILVACQTTPAPDPTPTAAPQIAPQADLTRLIVDTQNSAAYYTTEEVFLENGISLWSKAPTDGSNVTTIGRTKTVSGYLDIDFSGEIPDVIGGEFSVDLTGLRTNIARRDEMVGRIWLETQKFPTATFTLTPSELPDNYAEGVAFSFPISGELTVHGVTKEVTLEAEAVYADNTLTASATAPLLMTDFNIEPPMMARLFQVENEFSLTVDIFANTQN